MIKKVRKSKKIFLIFLSLLTLSCASITWLAYSAIKRSCSRCKRVRYNPRRIKHSNYLLNNHPVQEITFKTEDNINISGLLIERPNAKAVLLICHGFWQAKEFMSKLVDLFDEFTILLLDFRCHGNSEGDYISFGHNEYKDVLAGLDFLTKNLFITSGKNLPIIGLGVSMGTSALLKASTKTDKFKALILDSGFSKLDSQLCEYFKKISGLPCYFIPIYKKIFNYTISADIDEIHPEKFIKEIKIPVLIIHSKSDKAIPIEDAYKLHKAAQNKKELFLVDDCKHARIHKEYPELYKQKVLEFINSLGI